MEGSWTVQRRTDDDEVEKAHAPDDDAAREKVPERRPRRSSVIRRGNGRGNDMGEWVIDDVE